MSTLHRDFLSPRARVAFERVMSAVEKQTEAIPRHHEAAKTSGAPRCTRICDSVLRMVCWWRNTKAFQLVKQCGALQAKSGSCTSRASELPVGALTSGENFSTHLVSKRGV